MKISYEWLREYVNTKIRVDNLSPILTMAGHEVTAIEQRGNDFILEIEVTPNRADCLSHIGIAREVSAMTKKSLKLPVANIKENKSTKKSIAIEIENKKDCPLYTGRVIKNVNVAVSPKWLIRRIESIGLRPVNNIVDSTNFVLFEMGQPLHAFDLDKLCGDRIIIRRAKKGEKIITIDGIERELKPDILVIADTEGPVAIAGVMGGKQTEVTQETKNILLESACFDMVTTRRSSFKLGLSSDSSYRFERGIDIAGVLSGSDRASELISSIAKGSVCNLNSDGSKIKVPESIILRMTQLNKILGTKLAPKDVKDILGRLDFKFKGANNLEVISPSFRHDVSREADLFEEIARIYGYENIEPSAPNIITTAEDPESKDFMLKRNMAKEVLTSSGFNEVLTYSLVSRESISQMAHPQESVIAIQNPLSKEQEIMRQSLVPGILKSVRHNLSRQVQDIKIFELSNIYFKKEARLNEEPVLLIAQYEKSQK
ncbi:phenylalanine--tRNA ligase subunit beta, partial [Candidatus Omnitrophota bacterium]